MRLILLGGARLLLAKCCLLFSLKGDLRKCSFLNYWRRRARRLNGVVSALSDWLLAAADEEEEAVLAEGWQVHPELDVRNHADSGLVVELEVVDGANDEVHRDTREETKHRG